MNPPKGYPQWDADHAVLLMHALYKLEGKLLPKSPLRRLVFHSDESREYAFTLKSIAAFTEPIVSQIFKQRKGVLYF
jgi:hypothetical protein